MGWFCASLGTWAWKGSSGCKRTVEWAPRSSRVWYRSSQSTQPIFLWHTREKHPLGKGHWGVIVVLQGVQEQHRLNEGRHWHSRVLEVWMWSHGSKAWESSSWSVWDSVGWSSGLKTYGKEVAIRSSQYRQESVFRNMKEKYPWKQMARSGPQPGHWGAEILGVQKLFSQNHQLSWKWDILETSLGGPSLLANSGSSDILDKPLNNSKKTVRHFQLCNPEADNHGRS